MRNWIFVFVISLVIISCKNIFNSGEGRVDIQNIEVSNVDELTIDSMMEYYYYSASYFQKTVVMQGMVFFLGYDHKLYLISALHNFTGIDPDSRKSIKGLKHYPTDIWVVQPFYVDWGYRKNRYLYNNRDSIQSFRSRPDGGKYYKLYNYSEALFFGGDKNTVWDNYDLGAYYINDSGPLPRHILSFDKKWDFDTIHVGDTVFYSGLGADLHNFLPEKFIGKIIKTPSHNDPYFSSNFFSRPGSSGAPVFKISNHVVSLVGVIARGNADENVVLITPFKEALTLLKF